MSNTKKIALMSTLVLLLAVTAVFNFVLAGTRSTDVGAEGVQSVNFFTSHRAERSSTRSEEFVQLDGIISAYAADTQEYAEAVAEKQRMVSVMEEELMLETMIRSIGFTDAVVVIGSDSGNVNVFIDSSELNAETALKIYSIFEDEKEIREGNIVIMPIYAES